MASTEFIRTRKRSKPDRVIRVETKKKLVKALTMIGQRVMARLTIARHSTSGTFKRERAEMWIEGVVMSARDSGNGVCYFVKPWNGSGGHWFAARNVKPKGES